MNYSFSLNQYEFNPYAPPTFEIEPRSSESDEFNRGVVDKPFDPWNILMYSPVDNSPSPPKLTAERVTAAMAPKPKKAKLAQNAEETSTVESDEEFDFEDIDSDIDEDSDATVLQGSDKKTSHALYADETFECEDDEVDHSTQKKRAFNPSSASAFSSPTASPSAGKRLKAEPLSEFRPGWPPNFRPRELEATVKLEDGREFERSLCDLVRHANFLLALFKR